MKHENRKYGLFMEIKTMNRNSITRKLMGLAAALVLAAGAWATPDAVTFETTPPGGTLAPSNGGQTVGWGYTITNLSQYWFEATGLSSSGWTYADPLPNGDIFDYPILAPGNVTPTTASQTWVSGTTGLFEIQWHTGLAYNTQESGFFTLSGAFYDANPLTGGNFVMAAPEVSTLYSASAPEPFSLLLFATGFGVAVLARKRGKRNVIEANRER